MVKPILIEICVESLDHAVAAESGGAHRIELCHDLSCGGITPSTDLMRVVRRNVRIPIHVLIRPRAGDFSYSETEFENIQRDLTVAKDVGFDGVVLGLLNPSAQMDRERTHALVQSAHPLPVTFHRAFDQCPDLLTALEEVIATGAQRVLTSGGGAGAMDGLACLASLVNAAQERIVVMPGGGVRSTNVARILRGTGAREIHTSLDGSTTAGPGLFERKVREFRHAVEDLSR